MDEVKQKKEYRFVGFRLEHIKAFMVENGLQKWMPADEHVIRQSTDWLINVRILSPSFNQHFAGCSTQGSRCLRNLPRENSHRSEIPQTQCEAAIGANEEEGGGALRQIQKHSM